MNLKNPRLGTLSQVAVAHVDLESVMITDIYNDILLKYSNYIK